MAFYHFTRPGYVESILAEGINRGEVPLSPTNIYNAAWLTDDPNPRRQQWIYGTDKGAVRLTVELPDGEADPLLETWMGLAERMGVEDWWMEALNSAGGHSQERWYVYDGVIDPEWITKVERL